MKSSGKALNSSKPRQSDDKKLIKIVDTPSPALARGSAILDFVSASTRPVTAQEISTAFNLPKSSVHNLCLSLTSLNLLSRRSDQTFVIGPHVMQWARAFTQRIDVTAEFAHVLDYINELSGATFTLAFREGDEVIYVATRNNNSLATGDYRIGSRLPVPYTATGKALLSHLSDFQIAQLFENGLPKPRTKNSVQSIDRLIAQARRCRVEGYASDNQEAFDGVISYSSTILDAANQPIAAVAVSLPADDPMLKKKQNIIAGIKLVAERISIRLGADLGQ